MHVFMDELTRQAEAVAISIQQYTEAKAALDRPTVTRGGVVDIPDVHDLNNRAFLSAQAILTAGALVSKMLWPPESVKPVRRRRAIERSQAILAALGIEGEIPVLSDRKVRNSFEHFDERLDDFFAEDPNRGVIDRIITDSDFNEFLDSGFLNMDRPYRALRQLKIKDDTISVLEESVSLRDVHDAVTNIAQRAQKWVNGYLARSRSST